MSDTIVLVMTALLALGTLGGTLWSIWRIARHTPSRERAMAKVLGSMAGTALLGVILPAMLKGMLDPFPIWLVYAILTAGSASVLMWRWEKLEPERGDMPRLVITALALVSVLAMAGVAVT